MFNKDVQYCLISTIAVYQNLIIANIYRQRKTQEKAKCGKEPLLHMWMRRVNKGCDIKLLCCVHANETKNKQICLYLLLLLSSKFFPKSNFSDFICTINHFHVII